MPETELTMLKSDVLFSHYIIPPGNRIPLKIVL